MKAALHYVHQVRDRFHQVPGSSIIVRYIRSSYQNDPVRSAVELFLFLFAVYYLLAPSYSTTKSKNVPLTDEVGHDWDCWLQRTHIGTGD